jgi:SpoVK/Ycf46/Vps4 family AAA+-type ATPase
MSSDVVISLINSLRKNDKQAIDRSIRKLIEAAENRKQHKLAKKLREAYASTAESQHPTSFYPSSVTPESAEENQNLFEIRRSKTNLSQIILSETNKETLLEIINNYNKRELLKKHGLTNASRIILSGPPGTGKTLSAYVLAGELKI